MFKHSWLCVYSHISGVKYTVKKWPRTVCLNRMPGISSWHPTNYDESWWEWVRTQKRHARDWISIHQKHRWLSWHDAIFYILWNIKCKESWMAPSDSDKKHKVLIQTMWRWNRSSFSWAVKRQWHESTWTVMLEPCQPPIALTTNTLYNICWRQCPVNQSASPYEFCH